MNLKRYNELFFDNSLELTEDEISNGWHRCPDSDYTIIGPGMYDATLCMCDNSCIKQWKQTDEAIIVKRQYEALDRLAELDEANHNNELFRKTNCK